MSIGGWLLCCGCVGARLECGQRAACKPRPTHPPPPPPPLLPPHPIHAGLLFFRHGRNTTAFIDAWQRRLDADEKARAGGRAGQAGGRPGCAVARCWRPAAQAVAMLGAPRPCPLLSLPRLLRIAAGLGPQRVQRCGSTPGPQRSPAHNPPALSTTLAAGLGPERVQRGGPRRHAAPAEAARPRPSGLRRQPVSGGARARLLGRGDRRRLSTAPQAGAAAIRCCSVVKPCCPAAPPCAHLSHRPHQLTARPASALPHLALRRPGGRAAGGLLCQRPHLLCAAPV